MKMINIEPRFDVWMIMRPTKNRFTCTTSMPNVLYFSNLGRSWLFRLRNDRWNKMHAGCKLHFSWFLRSFEDGYLILAFWITCSLCTPWTIYCSRYWWICRPTCQPVCQPMLDRQSADTLTIECQRNIDRLSVVYRSTVGGLSVDCLIL